MLVAVEHISSGNSLATSAHLISTVYADPDTCVPCGLRVQELATHVRSQRATPTPQRHHATTSAATSAVLSRLLFSYITRMAIRFQDQPRCPRCPAAPMPPRVIISDGYMGAKLKRSHSDPDPVYVVRGRFLLALSRMGGGGRLIVGAICVLVDSVDAPAAANVHLLKETTGPGR